MKSIAITFLILGGAWGFAGEETNLIVATDWSAPVESNFHTIRGRLLILAGSEPAYGGPKDDNQAMTFVELQNSQGACCGSDQLFFDVTGLKCVLTDAHGKPVQSTMVSWGGRGALTPSWVVIPYNATLRLFVNSGSKSPLTVFPGGEPWKRWSIPSTDTNVYYLSGTLTIATPTNATLVAMPHSPPNLHEYAEWTGTLVFPKVAIQAGKAAKND